MARSTSIRTAKRRARLTTLGMAFAVLDLAADFLRRSPKWFLFLILLVVLTLAALAVKYWPITCLLFGLYLGVRFRHVPYNFRAWRAERRRYGKVPF